MKTNSHLIKTVPAGIVNEAVSAWHSGKLAEAIINGFERGALPATNAVEFLSSFILMPHVADVAARRIGAKVRSLPPMSCTTPMRCR